MNSKLHDYLNFLMHLLFVLFIFKYGELTFAFLLRGNISFVWSLFGLVISSSALVLKHKNQQIAVSLLSLAIGSIHIFLLNIVNQHFAFLFSLLAIHCFRLIFCEILPTEVDRLTRILLILQLCILYAFAALWKMNFDYLTGTQMLEHIRPFLAFPNANQPYPSILISISILGLLIESFLALQFIFRERGLEIIQSVGFLFHFLIIILIGEGLRNMGQLLIFAIATLSLYPLLDMRNFTGEKLTVFWDANCDFCGRFVILAKSLDYFGKFKFVDNNQVTAYLDLPFDVDLVNDTIVVLGVDSTTFEVRSSAILLLVSTNPFFWFAKPILILPGLRHISDSWYKKIASRRTCHIS